MKSRVLVCCVLRWVMVATVIMTMIRPSTQATSLKRRFASETDSLTNIGIHHDPHLTLYPAQGRTMHTVDRSMEQDTSSSAMAESEQLAGVEHIGEFVALLEELSSRRMEKTQSIRPEQHRRDLTLLLLDTPNLNLDVGGRLLDGRLELFLETPDVAVRLEGLFRTSAESTLTGLETQFLGGGGGSVLNTGPGLSPGLNPGPLSPAAPPHVASGGPLPTDLQQAQRDAWEDYETNFQSQEFARKSLLSRQERDSHEEERRKDGAKVQENEDVDKELMEELRERQARLQLRQREIEEEKESVSQGEDSKNDLLDLSPKREWDGKETGRAEATTTKEIKIAGMDLIMAILVFSGVMCILVFLCIYVLGCFYTGHKTKEIKQPALKSKISDMSEISAYMKSPTLFDHYIHPPGDHQATKKQHRSDGAKN